MRRRYSSPYASSFSFGPGPISTALKILIGANVVMFVAMMFLPHQATLYGLGGDTVAILHNPNSKHRSPLALWISFDGMKTWPYQRVLQAESVDGPKGRMNYPDGFVSADKQWLHFAFDDNRHRAVHYSAKLPPLP